jgi:hypothetical protein
VDRAIAARGNKPANRVSYVLRFIIAAFPCFDGRFRTALRHAPGCMQKVPLPVRHVRKRLLFPSLSSYLVRGFMPMHIRRCAECPKCSTRYLIGFSPYSNGSYLVPTSRGSSDEYTLYCACCTPPASSQWRWNDMNAFAVAKAAHERGYGDCTEIFLPGERRAPRSESRGEILPPSDQQRKTPE